MKTQDINKDTPLVMVTVGQLADFLATSGLVGERSQETAVQPVEKEPEEDIGWGLQCIMSRFHCKRTTAYEYKNGILAPAVSQVGRKIKVNLTLADQLFKEAAEKEKKANK